MIIEKFMPPFISFLQRNFDVSEHKFVFITSEKYRFGLTKEHGAEFIHDDAGFVTLNYYMGKSSKIILHGLWRDKVNSLLLGTPSFLKKSYWVMWGGDFYSPDTRNYQHRRVIQNVAYLVTFISGEYELVKKWYGAQGTHIKSGVYTSNLYSPVINESTASRLSKSVNILIGNSASISNNHLSILTILEQVNKLCINKIYAPLSYANKTDESYTMDIIKQGRRYFSDRFVALLEFMSFGEYLKFLNSIDIAIFNHDRQQACGNIITLLSLGKKIYLRKSVTTWNMLSDLGVTVYDIESFNVEIMDPKVAQENIKIIRQQFSEENLVKQLKIIF
jgi:dTDP-N-acetylfucosamine:lipid II N-acetylfucosaminyltransferase